MSQALSRSSLSGSTDLEDMSVMVVRTQGPAALFDDHRLVLHTSSYDAKRTRVFHACGEFMPPLPLPGGLVSCLGRVGRPCSGHLGGLGGQSKHSQMCELWNWLAGPTLFYWMNEFFKYILSTFRNVYYQKFQIFDNKHKSRENSVTNPQRPTTQIQQ